MLTLTDPETGLYPNAQKIRKEPWALSLTGSFVFFGVDEDGYPIMLDNCGHYVYVPDNRLEVIVN